MAFVSDLVHSLSASAILLHLESSNSAFCVYVPQMSELFSALLLMLLEIRYPYLTFDMYLYYLLH